MVAALAIVRRHPGNAIWWLFFMIAIALAAGTVMPEYGIYALKTAPGSLPAPAFVLALAEPSPIVALIGIVLVLQLFPDGRPVSRAWRVVLWVTVAALVLGVVGPDRSSPTASWTCGRTTCDHAAGHPPRSARRGGIHRRRARS